jgi:hypothetical protein
MVGMHGLLLRKRAAVILCTSMFSTDTYAHSFDHNLFEIMWKVIWEQFCKQDFMVTCFKNRCKDIALTFSYMIDLHYITLEMKLFVVW